MLLLDTHKPRTPSLLQHPRPRIREIASAAVTNMMRLSEDVDFVVKSLPNLLDLLSDLVKPTVDEPTAVNVSAPIMIYLPLISISSRHSRQFPTFQLRVETEFYKGGPCSSLSVMPYCQDLQQYAKQRWFA